MLSRWWAADARVERMGARPNRAVVVKTALTCGSYSHSSTVLGRRRERMKNSLVTMSARVRCFAGIGYAVATVSTGPLSCENNCLTTPWDVSLEGMQGTGSP
jgi:hypothetical protein